MTRNGMEYLIRVSCSHESHFLGNSLLLPLANVVFVGDV